MTVRPSDASVLCHISVSSIPLPQCLIDATPDDALALVTTGCSSHIITAFLRGGEMARSRFRTGNEAPAHSPLLFSLPQGDKHIYLLELCILCHVMVPAWEMERVDRRHAVQPHALCMRNHVTSPYTASVSDILYVQRRRHASNTRV